MLVIAGAVCAYSESAQEQKKQDIAKLLGLTDNMQQASQNFHNLFSSLEPYIPPNLKQSIQSKFESEIKKFTETIVNIYDENFSHDEIKTLISFYESSTGQKYKNFASLANTEAEPPQKTSPEKKKEIVRLIKITELESQLEQFTALMISYMMDVMDASIEIVELIHPGITPDMRDVVEAEISEMKVSIKADLKENMRKEGSKLLDSALLIYDKHFSQDEIKRMIRFFGGPLGKKLTGVAPLIIKETFNLSGELVSELAAAGNKSKKTSAAAPLSPSSEEISAQALAAAPFLLTKRDSRGHLLPGNGSVEKPKDRAAFQIYDKVTVKPTGKTSYKIGDTVDVLKPVKLVTFKGKSAQIVSRSGRGVVVGHTGKNIVIQLTNMWGIVAGGERIAPAANFKAVKCSIVPAGAGSKIQAAVAARVEESASPYLSQFFIIDKGADAGINIGDYFKVFEKPAANKLSDELLEAQVVNVGANSSTLAIRKISKGSLKPGDQAFLSHRNALLMNETAETEDTESASED